MYALQNKPAAATPTPKPKSVNPTPIIASAPAKAAVPYNNSAVSTNRAAASLTSTTASISTKSENALWHEEDMMYEAVRNKGDKAYARLVTNFGNLNLELYAPIAPRTCYNFLQLAHEGKYEDTIFHRLIPGFMVSPVWGSELQLGG